MATQKPMGRRINTGLLARIGMMGAITTVLSFFPEIPLVFFAPWLKLDFSYVPVLLTGFSLGFLPGLATLVIKNLAMLLKTDSAGIGQLADMLVGIAMLLPATMIYRIDRTRKGALIGMLTGILAMIATGVLLNRFMLLPLYLGSGFAAYMAENPYILWTAVAPFNLVKGGTVCIVVSLLYKRLAPFLKRGLRG